MRAVKYNKKVNHNMVVVLIFLSLVQVGAQEIDDQFAESLKIEANHNLNRLKSFSEEVSNNKIYDRERERGLAEYLEEQERWDLLRDRGLQEYRIQKKLLSPKEGSADHLEYLEEKESDLARYERSRKIHVRTRQQVGQKVDQTITFLESQELGLNNSRPRFDLRKRSQNKWTGTNSPFRGSSPSTSFVPSSPANDFMPVNDFPAAPAPFEPVPDESQFTPPPVYDSNNGGMPTTFEGEVSPDGDINIPPPPPPPPDFDF